MTAEALFLIPLAIQPEPIDDAPGRLLVGQIRPAVAAIAYGKRSPQAINIGDAAGLQVSVDIHPGALMLVVVLDIQSTALRGKLAARAVDDATRQRAAEALQLPRRGVFAANVDRMVVVGDAGNGLALEGSGSNIRRMGRPLGGNELLDDLLVHGVSRKNCRETPHRDVSRSGQMLEAALSYAPASSSSLSMLAILRSRSR